MFRCGPFIISFVSLNKNEKMVTIVKGQLTRSFNDNL